MGGEEKRKERRTMPRVRLDKSYKNKRFDKAIRVHKADKDLTFKEVAESIGLTERGFQKKRKNGNFTWEELCGIFRTLEFRDNERLEVMREFS